MSESNETNEIDHSNLNAENDNDLKLIHFQEIIHVDDIDECRAILESTNWNLDQAVQTYFTGQQNNLDDEDLSSSLKINNINQLNDNDLYSFSNSQNLSSPIASRNSLFTNQLEPYTTNEYESHEYERKKRLLKFNIEYLNQKFTLHIPDDEKVNKLKELIKQKIDVDVKNQNLIGWKNKMFINDETSLFEINLPLENDLMVKNMGLLSEDSTISTNDHVFPSTSACFREDESYELFIKFINTNKQLTILNHSKKYKEIEENLNDNKNDEVSFYRLNFDGSTKFQDIKRRVSLLINVLTNNQEWWYFVKSDESLFENDLELIKSSNNLSTFHKLIESEKLFSLPLSSIIQNDCCLAQLDKVLTDLTNPNNTNIKKLTTSTDKCHTSDANIDSKMTSNLNEIPSQLEGVQCNSNSTVKKLNNKIIFVITSKKVLNEVSSSSDQNEVNSFLSNFTSDSLMIKKAKISQEKDCKIDKSIEDECNLDNDEEMHNIEEEELDENFVFSSNQMQNTLIPKDTLVGDELSCTNAIVKEFTKRYGPIVPLFYIGSLEDVINEALMCPAKDRKLLGIYLHSDKTVFCNIFCSKTLCDENVINFLSSNFVVWPWDITNKEHEQYFYDTCSKYLGNVFLNSLQSNKEKFPTFLVITRVRSNNEVAAIIEGDSTNENMMQRLMQAYEVFESQRIKDEYEERSRDERERIKREQDAAYQASLEFDKAKKQRQTEENEKMKLEAQLIEESERKKVLEKDIRKKVAASYLKDEPNELASNITKIRFRLPEGETLQRKFYINEKLESILNFVTSHGFFVEEYKILSSWPRRDLTNESVELTIEQLKLYPQETLTLEQR